MSSWVILKQTLLQRFMQELESVRTPQTACHRGLVGDHANQVAVFTEVANHFGCTVEQDHLFGVIHISCLSKVQNAVAVEECHRRMFSFLERHERSRLYEGSVHVSWLGWRLMGFVLGWRP